ncbi:PorP/SprF family type IX secretion system membrane protein [Limibacter armeniacum]|uniref:PorP/SprF family type IX secretion system membrane protein n=1 Tax=Limibacter armeniacum TaxID=466084 RepID=UPI002FE5D801
MNLFKYISSVLLLLFFMAHQVHAQQPHVTQYSEIISTYNPAFTGIENFSDFNLGVRQQWAGDEGAPTTMFFNSNFTIEGKRKRFGRRKLKYKSPYDIDKLAEEVEYPENALMISDPSLFHRYVKDSIKTSVRRMDSKTKSALRKKLRQKSFRSQLKHGLGAAVLYQEAGVFTSYQVNGSYAFHMPISRKWQAAIGVAGVYSNNRLNVSDLTIRDVNDPTYIDYQSIGGAEGYGYLNVGATIYNEHFYAGYSYTNMLGSSLGESQLQLNEKAIEDVHNILLGLRIEAGTKMLLTPGILVQQKQLSPSVVNLSMKAVYDNKLMVGAYYRHKESVDFMAGIMITDAIKVGYAFDYALTELKTNNVGTHEVSLRFMMVKGKAPSPYIW